jgi:hypothetical protein
MVVPIRASRPMCPDYPDDPVHGELPVKDGIYDHPIDALRYFFINAAKSYGCGHRKY